MPRSKQAAARDYDLDPWTGVKDATRAYSIVIPGLKLCSLNVREHWAKRANRVRKERALVALKLCEAFGKNLLEFKPPIIVTIIRMGPRLLDSDNAVGSCKAVRDEVAKWLGTGDSPTSGVTWRYDQHKTGKGQYGVQITFQLLQGEVQNESL